MVGTVALRCFVILEAWWSCLPNLKLAFVQSVCSINLTSFTSSFVVFVLATCGTMLNEDETQKASSTLAETVTFFFKGRNEIFAFWNYIYTWTSIYDPWIRKCMSHALRSKFNPHSQTQKIYVYFFAGNQCFFFFFFFFFCNL